MAQMTAHWGESAGRGAVVVTGTSSGIGRCCALTLDAEGFRVFAGVRRPEDGEALARAASPRLTPLLLDVTDAASIASASGRVTRQQPGGLLGLVNNAGIAVGGSLELLPPADLRRQFEVNVIGTLAVTQAFLPLLRARPGRVINIGSVVGRLAIPFLSPYCAAKAALAAMTDALRMELRPWRIHVALIEPGSVATPIWSKGRGEAEALLGRLPPEEVERYGEARDAMWAFVERMAGGGIRPEVVARAVRRALTARRPRPRYLVGRDAWLQADLLRRIPHRLRDHLILAGLGAPRRPGPDR
jgi:NAD(P)-dependent dehydrogenase (short-subunit alcohol dehydrogenase family)